MSVNIFGRGWIYTHPAHGVSLELRGLIGWLRRHESTVVQGAPRLYKPRSPQSSARLQEKLLVSMDGKECVASLLVRWTMLYIRIQYKQSLCVAGFAVY
jgi:hypothetical protein